jgi:hypothetical protein
MPLIDPDNAPKPKPSPVNMPPEIAAPSYKGVTVDTRYIPTSSLMTHVEGSSWTVNYYSQVLNVDNALAGQEINRNAIHQQYRLIKGLELKVTTPLASNQDETTKSMVVTGDANVYPFLIPNEGDMFLADIGDGREGVFKVTVSERKSLFKDTIHHISYQLIDYSTVERRADFDSKVIETLRFIRDFLEHGQNPMLHEEDYAILADLRDEYGDMLQRYFRSFMNREFGTLMLPNQPESVYDHYMVNAVTSYFNVADAKEIQHIRKMNVGDDLIMGDTSLWDVITYRNPKLLKHAFSTHGLVRAKTFDKNPVMESIYFSGISYVVYPKNSELFGDHHSATPLKIIEDQAIVNIHSQVKTLADLLGVIDFGGLTQDDSPPIHSVTIDDYYIFSKAFYENTRPGQSRLELCVRDYLEGKAPNYKSLLAFCQTYHAWGSLERFYYVPIILILIKAAIRSV